MYNMNIPPYTTTDASKMNPAHAVTAAESAYDFPVRGEKQWQMWAGDMVDYGDMQESFANMRPPYHSTAQLGKVIEEYGMT